MIFFKYFAFSNVVVSKRVKTQYFVKKLNDSIGKPKILGYKPFTSTK